MLKPVIIEIAVPPRLASDVAPEAFTLEAAPALPGVALDPSFSPVPIPRLGGPRSFGLEVERETEGPEPEAEPVVTSYIVRGEIEEEQAEALAQEEGVIGVFADVLVETQLICPGNGPLGTHHDVERLLCTARLHAQAADGRGVMVAIVDTGVNIAYLNSRGKQPNFDAARSWVPRPGLTPGQMPVGHGTMCAFDVCIAAPRCTLLDIALLSSTRAGGSVMDGLLSDGVRAYNHLADIMRAPRRPGEGRSMVVNNSWGMFDPKWDFPVGHPGNYSHNPNHPFNVIVGTLEGLGADILFAAGNCGRDCPDGRCSSSPGPVIFGANSHPKVLSVAGVDVQKQRVGYSSQGPGCLARNKPDLCGFTHFAGSGVYASDGGTSAATPVVAGLVAAYRSKRPYSPNNPAVAPETVRNLLTSTCEDLGSAGYDLDHGFGVVRGCAIADRFGIRPDICRIIPGICERRPIRIDICRRFPQLCDPPRLPPGPIPGPRPLAGSAADPAHLAMLDLGPEGEALNRLSPDELYEFLYMLGYQDGLENRAQSGPDASGNCTCG